MSVLPGLLDTLTIEALMQDGKALQSGTSHFLDKTLPKLSMFSLPTKKASLIMFGLLRGAFRPA
jgi:prolyl-tRNA synthetase